MIISANNRLIIQRLIALSSSILNYSTKRNNNFKLPSYTSESTSQLIKIFNNRGEYERAFQLFDMLIKQNNVSIISLLTILDTCIRSNHIERGRQIETFINQSIKWKDDIRLQTSLIKMYMKYQMIDQDKISKLIIRTKKKKQSIYSS
ncbi:unnamed protein product [Rotaria sordida]|uniref:Pentatricopeptide repeat-containing protein n=1 Tax=Rotaria sordida TaxID=392033 RepID=A0A819YBN8_9BILA|nr:unnamed protein product [Rotaria sordida]